MASQIEDHINHSAYRDIQRKLKSLFDRFYRIQVIQGLIVTLVFLGFSLLGLIILNQVQTTSSSFREISFYFLFGITVLIFIILVIGPLAKWLKTRSLEKLFFSESIVRQKFPHINDSLFNLIELGQMSVAQDNSDLVMASINDRANRLSLFKFNLAVPVKKIFYSIIAIGVVVLIYAILSLATPEFMKSGYSKTIHYSDHVLVKKSIQIDILNDSLTVGMGHNFTVEVSAYNVSDDDQLYLRMGASKYLMNQLDSVYSYEIESVNGNISLSFEIADFRSQNYILKVLPLPELSAMKIVIWPPEYTRIEALTLLDEGDMIIAEGSDVEWSVHTANTDFIQFSFADDTLILAHSEDKVVYKKRFIKSGDYEISLLSDLIASQNKAKFNIEVIKDLYPGIELSQQSDSAAANQVFFQMNIEDDYGFSKMLFIVREMITGDTLYIEGVKIGEKVNFQRVYYGVDFDAIELEGREIEYFVSVWDNDEINGFKKTDSRVFRKAILTKEELFKKNRERGDELSESIKESKDIIDQLREQVSDLMDSQIIEDREDWELNSKVDEIAETRDILEEMIENIKNDNKKLNEYDADSNISMSEIFEKQKKIEELFEKLMDEELEKLFDEFEKLAEEMSKKERIEKTEELKLNLTKLEEQLDINLELLQKLEIEKEVLDIANEMNKLAEELEKSEENSDTREMEKKFDQLSEKYDEQLQKNQEFNKPDEMNDFEEEREEIKEDMADLNKEKKDKSKSGNKKDEKKEKKKSTSNKMKKLSEKMKEKVGQGEGQNVIDIDLIRQLSRELNDYSFRQEELMNEIANHSSRSLKFHEVGVEQRQMELKFDVIRDSLKSLGYKEPMIAALLSDEVFHVETSLLNLNRSVQEGLISQVRYEQQKVMEGANELAVRLDELVDNLQSMSGEGEGQSKFTDSNPQEGAEKVGEMKKQQQSLKNQMKQMIEQMKEGMKNGIGGKEMVKMLSEREQLRRALEELRNSGQLGEDARKKIQDAEKMMEEVEKDIIYNKVNDVTIQKEEWIQTRLLEAENAEKEREKEEVRVSEEFKGIVNPGEIPSWKENEGRENEMGRTMNYSDIKLKQFYQDKYKSYLKRLNKKRHDNKVPLY